jgi:hypothetical protein
MVISGRVFGIPHEEFGETVCAYIEPAIAVDETGSINW